MFNRGKNTCRILKEIRRQIAEQNDISLVIDECTYKGECLGTCPRCEAEVRYLEEQLAERSKAGKALKVAGVSAAMVSLLAPSCAPSSTRTVPPPETEGEVELLQGDVVYVPDEIPESDPASSESEPVTASTATPAHCIRGRVAMPEEPDEKSK